MTYAVIDVGTNSCRLYISQTDGQTQEACLKELKTTRLGEGIMQSPFLREKPMKRTLEAVAEFVRRAREHQVADEHLYIYATAVVREAENKDEFARKLFERTGIPLIVLPGEAEGEIAFLGASEGKKNCAVLDIGGGSTELTVRDQNGRIRAFSQKIGCVRLKERFASRDGRVNVQEVKDYVSERFIPLYGERLPLKGVKELIGVSGTPTTFVSLLHGKKEYDPSFVQGKKMTLIELEQELNKQARMTLHERETYSGAFAPRADILVYGGCLLSALMSYYGFPSLTVSDRDSLEGFLSCVLSDHSLIPKK